MTQEEADKIGYVGTVDKIPGYSMGPWTMTTSESEFTSDQQMRMEAVQRAVELYGSKQAPNLEGYNESFKKLYTEIYNFYVNK